MALYAAPELKVCGKFAQMWRTSVLPRLVGPLAILSSSSSHADGEEWKLATAMCATAVIAALTPRIESRAAVVDCGSSSTRVILFETRVNRITGSRTIVTRPMARLPMTMAEALREAKHGEFADGVAAVIPRRLPVMVGGTAGAREILKRTEASGVNAIQEALEKSRRAPCSVRVLTGEEEAALELKAARFVTQQRCGVLAGGGKSVQVACDDFKASIPLDTLAGHQLILNKGSKLGASMWEWECRRRVVNALDCRLDGRFAAIELAAKTLRIACGDGEVQAPLIVDRDTAIAALRRGMCETYANEPKLVVYSVHLLAVLELAFEREATFIVLRDHVDANSQHNTQMPIATWPLGVYLERYFVSGHGSR